MSLFRPEIDSDSSGSAVMSPARLSRWVGSKRWSTVGSPIASRSLGETGRPHVVMERRELLERLAPLIPPPRAHQVRYHGVLAPCASGRDRVVPAGAGARPTQTARSIAFSPESDGGSTGAADGRGDGETLVRGASDLLAERSESLARRIAWADLLKRVFEVDALRCPACGERMRLIAAITDPSVARRILECLALSSRAPPLAPARDLDLEQSIGRGDCNPEPVEADGDPGVDFDQSPCEGPTSDDAI